jgi:hypothetical protein
VELCVIIFFGCGDDILFAKNPQGVGILAVLDNF